MRILVGTELLPLSKIQEAVRRQALTSSEAAQQWVAQHGMDDLWDPRVLTNLCQQVLRERDSHAAAATATAECGRAQGVCRALCAAGSANTARVRAV